MSRNDQDPDQQSNQELHQLRGYRGHEYDRQADRPQFHGATNIQQQKIEHFIDELSQKVPGTSRYTQRIKDASATLLHYLEVERDKLPGSFADFFNRLFGGK